MRKKTERLSFWVPIFGATAFAVGYGEAGGFGSWSGPLVVHLGVYAGLVAQAYSIIGEAVSDA